MARHADYIPSARKASYPLRDGCFARPLVDGEPAFRRICEAVEAAHASVWVTVAFLERDSKMPDHYGTFFDVLARARARGLENTKRRSRGEALTGLALAIDPARYAR